MKISFDTLAQGAGKIARRALIIGAVAASALVGTAAVAQIAGAGATFPHPIYARWAEQWAAAGGQRLNYQAIGSGAGVTQIINRTVDFGASDAPVAPERLASNHLLQFPAVVGGVVVVVNIPGVDGSALKLTGPLVADMYLGRVRMWNDPRIAALNPGVSLPAVAIAPVYRADSSGTTSIFTTYLSAVSGAFSSATGAGSSVSWRAGIGAPGNAGVAGAVRRTRGGLGYVEYAFASLNHMPTPQLQNRAGAFLAPSRDAFAAAASGANWAGSASQAASMVNTAGRTAWPIVSATYILIPTNPTDAGRTLNVLRFFDWAYNNGGPAASSLNYVMLPESVRNQARQRWCQIRANGRPVWTGCR